MADAETVNVRYLVDDVAACVDFYTRHFGFTVGISSPGVRRRHPRQPAAPAVRPAELGRPGDDRRGTTRPRRLEPHPPHRRRPRRARSPASPTRAFGSATRS